MQEALASLVPIINQAVHEWMQDQDPVAIKKKVFSTLNKAKDEIAPKLLGFTRDSWNNKWEIDHCNGRSGESSLGDYLKQHQEAGIKQFIEELDLTTVRPFTKSEKDEMRSDYRRRVINKVRESVRVRAEQDAARLLNSISVDNLVDLIKQTEALINSAPSVPVSSPPAPF